MTKKSELLENMRRLAGLEPMSYQEKKRMDDEESLNEKFDPSVFKKGKDKKKASEEEEEHDMKDMSPEEKKKYMHDMKKKKMMDENDGECDDYKKPGEEEEEDSDYQAFFKKMLDQHGGSIKDMDDEEKKHFFAKVEKAWNSKDEPGKDGAKNESENPEKDRAAAAVGADMGIVLGDKEVVPSKIMVDMMNSLMEATDGNSKEIAMIVNEMIFEACASVESKYIKLRGMINRSEVSKDMMVHEGKDGPVFGEKMDEAKMNEMYNGSSEDSISAAGQAIMNFYAIAEGKDEDADSDVGVDKKVRDADKKISDLKDIKKDDKLTKDKAKMTDKVTEGYSIQSRVDDIRVLGAALGK